MSRTDKTKPWWVRVSEHHARQNHDHSKGPCDLPASPLAHHNAVYGLTRCSWDDGGVYYGCCKGCGCRLCTGQYYRIHESRTQRHAVRQALTMIRHGADDEAARRIDLTRSRRRGYW